MLIEELKGRETSRWRRVEDDSAAVSLDMRDEMGGEEAGIASS